MSIIDTHAHLYDPLFQDDLNAVVSRARNAGVIRVLMPNIDETTIGALKTTVSRYPDFFSPMMGLHPAAVTRDWKKPLQTVYEELATATYIAIGEIGIDLYWDTTYKAEQIALFEEQLKWSIEYNLPVSIHSRNATTEVVNSIRRVGANQLRGVFHSFSGGKEELRRIMELENFFVGINGIVTFKNSRLKEVLTDCPHEKVLLETDAPYLAPVPHRGKRNESAFLIHVVRKIGEIWGAEEAVVSSIIERNARALFHLG